jgi:peroxiredoxin
VCRAEQPDLNQLAERYEGRVVFVGVSNHDTIADGKAYVRDLDVPYAMAHAPEVWERYGVPYQPVTVVIDGQGRIATQFDGEVHAEELEDEIEAVL